MPLTERQKQILHRAIDSARDQGSGQYVGKYGLPSDIVAHVAMYEGLRPRLILELSEWLHDQPFEDIWYTLRQGIDSIDWSRLDSYMAKDTHTDLPMGTFFDVGYPAARGPILVVLQHLWDMSEVPRFDNKKCGYPGSLDNLRRLLHQLVDRLK